LVATHSTQSDCWIIVSGKVYSVSSYIAMHPGGRSAIITMCGKDATAAFTSRGGTGSHSSSARSLLGTFLVGSLGSTVKL
jgi:cytochrome b involved in lipid metabolism